MKEFEKWRDELHTGTGIYTTAAIRKGWKAALNWVLKIKKEGDKLAYYNDDILMAIEGEIKKELEE